MKTQEIIEEIQKKIEQIKTQLLEIGPMRPGSVNEQFKDPKKKTGSYYQLNYTYKMKTKTEYVRKLLVSKIKEETQEYKKFKALTDEWISLSIEVSKLNAKKAKDSRRKTQ